MPFNGCDCLHQRRDRKRFRYYAPRLDRSKVEQAEERAEAAEKERDDWKQRVELERNERCIAEGHGVTAEQAILLIERDDARKALAEYREKWGHIPCCGCGRPPDSAKDPRCAPEEVKA